ncbi:hypothetical protein [Neisseria weixii]|nr:hypothetical protein [Neisseria weixii]
MSPSILVSGQWRIKNSASSRELICAHYCCPSQLNWADGLDEAGGLTA